MSRSFWISSLWVLCKINPSQRPWIVFPSRDRFWETIDSLKKQTTTISTTLHHILCNSAFLLEAESISFGTYHSRKRLCDACNDYCLHSATRPCQRLHIKPLANFYTGNLFSVQILFQSIQFNMQVKSSKREVTEQEEYQQRGKENSTLIVLISRNLVSSFPVEIDSWEGSP